jgi:hypothetical protein
MEKKTYKTPGVESYYARIEDVLQVVNIGGNGGIGFGGGGTQDARTKERNSLEESFNAETQSAQSNSLW